jgi:hypothetical protein
MFIDVNPNECQAHDGDSNAPRSICKRLNNFEVTNRILVIRSRGRRRWLGGGFLHLFQIITGSYLLTQQLMPRELMLYFTLYSAILEV